MENQERKFDFWTPVSLTKNNNGDWRIRGLASTEDVDLQGEVVRQHSLDITPLKEGRGILNYDHSNKPEDILGVIDDADIKEDGLHIDGYLFKNSKNAQAVYNILTSLKDKDKSRVGLSIEGKIYNRGGPGGKIINAARIDKVAVTLDPVNPNTYAHLVKSLTGEVLPESTETNQNELGVLSVDIKPEVMAKSDSLEGSQNALVEGSSSTVAKDPQGFKYEDILEIITKSIQNIKKEKDITQHNFSYEEAKEIITKSLNKVGLLSI